MKKDVLYHFATSEKVDKAHGVIIAILVVTLVIAQLL